MPNEEPLVISVLILTVAMTVSMRMSMVGTTAFPPRPGELLEGEDSAGGKTGGEDDVDNIDAKHDDSIDNGANADERVGGDGDDGGDDALDSGEWVGVEIHF